MKKEYLQIQLFVITILSIFILSFFSKTRKNEERQRSRRI